MTHESFEALFRQCHYRFQNLELLQQALTHRSFHHQHNERLEFLGDALLETIISAYLFREHPHLSEGELTRLRMLMVRGEHLAQLAKQLKLGDYLRLGLGERKAGGIRRQSILADAFEALIAAIYLDSNYLQCEQSVLLIFAAALKDLSRKSLQKDAKTTLQEYLQQRGFPLPVYELISETGPDHQPLFEVAVRSASLEVLAQASSRKKSRTIGR